MAKLKYVEVAKGTGSAVLMLLHGIGANERSMIPVAEGVDPRWTVISLQAPIAMGSNAFGWFPVTFTEIGPVIDAAQAERSRIALLEFIEEYKREQHCSEVYLMGFSQGAIMAAVAALTAPEVVQGAVCFSGRFPKEFLPLIVESERLAATRLLVVHGAKDEKLPIQHGRATRELLRHVDAPHEYCEFEGGHTIPEEMRLKAHRWLESCQEEQVLAAGNHA